jgi:hypothetical protein
MDLLLALFQREALRHIPGADDEIELKREVLCQLLAVVVDRHGVKGTEPLEVFDIVRNDVQP